MSVPRSPAALQQSSTMEAAPTIETKMSSSTFVDHQDKSSVSPAHNAASAQAPDGELLVEPTEYIEQARLTNADMAIGYRGDRTLEKERKAGRIGLRSQQAMLHMSLTQARISDLERELEKLKSHVFDTPKEEMRKEKMKYPIHQREIRRSTAADFEVTKTTYDTPVEKRPALEVLISEADYSQTSEGLTVQSQDTANFKNIQNAASNKRAQTPERLRIRSTPLLIHLKSVTGETVRLNDSADGRNDYRQVFAGRTFLRPFKLFVKHEKSIRQSLVDLQSQVDKQKQTPMPEGVVNTSLKRESSDFEFTDEDLLEDLKLLVEFLDNDLQPTFHLRQLIHSETASNIEFGDLWHLFSLGATVVCQADDSRAYRVVGFTGGRDPLTKIMDSESERVPALGGFVVDCLGLTFDGSEFVPSLHKFTITKFLGSRSISSLPVYPLKFHKDYQALATSLCNRGKRFQRITAPPFSHHFMTGHTLDEPSHEIDAPVIVDMPAAFNRIADWKPPTKIQAESMTKADLRETRLDPYCGHMRSEGCCGSDVIFKDHSIDEQDSAIYFQNNGNLLGPRKKEELTEEDWLLLPDRVHAFVLRNRQWATVKIADLSDMKYQHNFDKLMLPEKHKTSILALVNTHENARSAGRASIGAGLDLVKGKGTGLILLLHGEPGVGKTSTAECVADSTKRPLFPITCGDIGETAMEVEKNLSYNFTLAHKWGCVLLLDEADVFLVKRSKTDLRRNAVTSVFLRSLEYYGGILFLTTNRVGGIDPAFKSRIHLSLYYPRLRKDETVKLYKTFIQRAKDEQVRVGISTFKIDKKQITEFARQHYREMDRDNLGTWNGRQIRNAFQAAIALVEHESHQATPGAQKPVLGAAQFRIVAESSKEFDKYLISTLGAGESDMAIREGWRADRFPNVVLQSYSGDAPKPAKSHRSKGRSSRAKIESDTEDTSSESDASEDDSSSDDGDA